MLNHSIHFDVIEIILRCASIYVYVHLIAHLTLYCDESIIAIGSIIPVVDVP